MEPEIRRIDPPQPVNAVVLIQRGRLLLQALSNEAHAARVDAKRAELELALATAEAGEFGSLQQWLASYQATNYLAPESATTTGTYRSVSFAPAEDTGANAATPLEIGLNAAPLAAAPLVAAPLVAAPPPARNWDMFLPHARQRLLEVQNNLLDSPRPARSELQSLAATDAAGSVEVNSDNSKPISDAPQNAINKVGNQSRSSPPKLSPKDVPTTSDATLTDQKKSSKPSQDSSRLKSAAKPVKPGRVKASSGKVAPQPSKPELVAVAQTFDAAQAEEHVQKQRKLLLLSGVSGLSASLFVHILVVIALMIITLKLPATTASMVFESSATESLQETLELTQPTEISAAEVTPESPSEAVTDPSESLAEISALTSESFTAATPTPTSALSSLATAASASASSGKPHPASANASFFGAAASGNCFCYVIDSSESMRGGPWEAAKAELLRSLATLKDNQRFYIIFFNKELSAISRPGEREPAPRPLYATKENLDHTRGWIETLRIAPGAPPNKALKLAIEREPDAIYLLTDGDTKVDVAEFLRSHNRITDFVNGEQVMVPIHTIAFYSQLGEALMKRIAVENKGQFIYVPKPGQR